MTDGPLHARRRVGWPLPAASLARLRARLKQPVRIPSAEQRRRKRCQKAVEAIGQRPENALRLLTLNIAHGRRRVPHQALVSPQRVRRNLDEVAGLIAGVGAELVALQEADGPSAWSGRFDHVATLAQATRFDAHFRGDHNPFSLGRHNLASGTALVARWPLEDTSSHHFSSSWRCTKGFVAATMAVPQWSGHLVDIVSVHLDFLLPEMRRQQIEALAAALADRDTARPLIVLGDLNCCWQQEPESIQLLADRLGLRAFEPEHTSPTYPAYRPRRRLDWILISEHLRWCGYRRLPVKVSDHLGVLADVTLA